MFRVVCFRPKRPSKSNSLFQGTYLSKNCLEESGRNIFHPPIYGVPGSSP